MSHRRIRDRVEDELFKELRTQEDEADMAQTTRTRRIVEATKDLVCEDTTLTARQLHTRLSRNGVSLPKLASFAPYATQARKELGIDGRKAVNGEPQGEDPAGASEARAEDEAPAPPAEKERVEINRGVKISQRGKVYPESKEEMAALQEEADERMSRLEKPDQENPTPDRPSNEAQVRLERGSDVVATDRGRPGPIVWVHPQIADPRVLDGLSAAGYVPVVCENPDHIRAVDPMPIGGVDVIMRAALGAIRGHTGYQNVKEDFGKRLAEGLLAAMPEEGGER